MSIKKIANEAKSRLKSGYWEEFYKNRDEDMQRANQLGVNKELVRDVYKSRNTRAKRELVWGSLYPVVREIVEREQNGETVLNPIGILINKTVFDALDQTSKQRYVLDLSEIYLEIRKEIEMESKIQGLKAKTLD